MSKKEVFSMNTTRLSTSYSSGSETITVPSITKNIFWQHRYEIAYYSVHDMIDIEDASRAWRSYFTWSTWDRDRAAQAMRQDVYRQWIDTLRRLPHDVLKGYINRWAATYVYRTNVTEELIYVER